MRSRSSEIGVKEYVLCFIVILAICFGFQACHTSIEQGNWHEEIVAICGKEVVTVGSGDSLSHQYRIYFRPDLCSQRLLWVQRHPL